jgi:RNA polymerase sigma factor (sigma-70 family)
MIPFTVLSVCSLCLAGGTGLPSLAPMTPAPHPPQTIHEWTDAALVAASLRGERGPFEELARRYYRPVCAFLWKRVRRPELVEDLAQETFLEAYRSLGTLGRPEQFAGWLFGIARNRCGKWLRRPRLALFSPAEGPEPAADDAAMTALEELEEQRQQLARLERELAGLPEETRRLLELKHRHGKTCEEIATELRRPVGTIKSLLSRTYKALRARLDPSGEDTP